MKHWLTEAVIGVLTVVCMAGMAVCWAGCKLTHQEFKVWRMFQDPEEER